LLILPWKVDPLSQLVRRSPNFNNASLAVLHSPDSINQMHIIVPVRPFWFGLVFNKIYMKTFFYHMPFPPLQCTAMTLILKVFIFEKNYCFFEKSFLVIFRSNPRSNNYMKIFYSKYIFWKNLHFRHNINLEIPRLLYYYKAIWSIRYMSPFW